MTDRCICIACFSRDAKMCSILNNNLPELYEKLANIQLSEVVVPKTMCYICFSQLKKCYKFMEMSQKAGKILTQLYSVGHIQIKQEKEVFELKSTNNFVKTILNPISLPDDKDEDNKTSDIIIRKNIGNTRVISSSSNHKPEEIDIQIDIEEALLTVKEELLTVKEEPVTTEIEPASAQMEEIYLPIKTEKVEAGPPRNLESEHNIDLPKAKIQTDSKVLSTEKDCKKIMSKGKNHVCIQCKKAFTRYYYLRRHMVTHTGEKRFACKTCHKRFTQNGHLRQHMRLHTGKKLFQCDICCKEYSHKYNFTVHVRKHSSENLPSSKPKQEKPHKCNLCSSAFYSKGDLKRHVMTHTGEKPFSCDFCNFRFSQKSHLKSHIRFHTDEKPYICNFCKLAFTQKSYLDDHISVVHMGGRLYPCSFPGCKKSFQTKNKIINHRRVHTGERPFACDKCGKSYKQKGHLTTHNSAVHAKEEIEKDLLAATKLMM